MSDLYIRFRTNLETEERWVKRCKNKNQSGVLDAQMDKADAYDILMKEIKRKNKGKK